MWLQALRLLAMEILSAVFKKKVSPLLHKEAEKTETKLDDTLVDVVDAVVGNEDVTVVVESKKGA